MSRTIGLSDCGNCAVSCAKAVNNKVKVRIVNFFIEFLILCIGTGMSLLL